MRSGAQTPEELETLLEDAFVVRDRQALAALFEDGAVLGAGGLEARGGEAITGLAGELWEARAHLSRRSAPRSAGPGQRPRHSGVRHQRAAPRRRRRLAVLDLAPDVR